MFLQNLSAAVAVGYANILTDNTKILRERRREHETLLPAPENPENVPALFFYAAAQVPIVCHVVE